jgi:NTE family protein
MLKLSSLVCVILFSSGLFAQGNSSTTNKNRPKIGLVLSGGGAKGFAHIGAIKLLEEAGIKPDYITGTSMGSIVGALYAMGYTVDEMTEISTQTEWGVVLTNTVSLEEITVVEKPYYGSFLTELDVTKSGVSLPGGLIEGQNLLQYLSLLTRPVHGITDFTKFPIPYTCVATNIVTGDPVALNSGNITNAIRASMAIPTAFTPVKYDSLLLIDGGWTRNLPVQEAKDMGADIIISVDVGSPLKTEEELQSMVSILDQTAWILSTKDTEKQLEMSDYVISPAVSNYASFAFEEADTIIKLGYEAAFQQKAVFEELSRKIYSNGKYEGVVEKPFFDSVYRISKIEVTGTELTNPSFVSGRLKIDPNQPISAKEIEEKIGLLYGTMYYKKVGFQIIPQAGGTQTLRVDVVEDNPAKLKLSLYYDNENSVGVNVNLTLRNLLLKQSRLIFDGFLSENPILGLKYFKYFGQDQHSFLIADFKYVKDSEFWWINLYGDPSQYSYQELSGNLGLAYAFDNNLTFATTIGYERARAVQKSNPDTLIDKLTQKQVPLRLSIFQNNFDKVVFPTKGIKFMATATYNSGIDHRAQMQEGAEWLQAFADEIFKLDPYVMFRISVQDYIKISRNFSLYADARMDMGSTDFIGFNDDSKIGGIAPILNTGVPFWGLNGNEINISQVAMASLGFQWNMVGNLYLKGKVNYANTEFPMNWFRPLDNTDAYTFDLYGETHTDIWGYGAELAYNTPLGPLRAVVHKNQYSKDVNFFVAIGFNIYKSNGDF